MEIYRPLIWRKLARVSVFILPSVFIGCEAQVKNGGDIIEEKRGDISNSYFLIPPDIHFHREAKQEVQAHDVALTVKSLKMTLVDWRRVSNDNTIRLEDLFAVYGFAFIDTTPVDSVETEGGTENYAFEFLRLARKATEKKMSLYDVLSMYLQVRTQVYGIKEGRKYRYCALIYANFIAIIRIPVLDDISVQNVYGNDNGVFSR